MTLEQAVEFFIIEQQLRGNTDKTVHGYKGFLRRFVEHMAGQGVTDLADLTIMHINKYQLYINNKACERGRNDKLTKRSVQTYIRHIRVFTRFCYETELIKTDIHSRITIPKAEKTAIMILTDDEVNAILSCFGKSETGLRNTAIILLLLDCGLRLSEAAGIRTEDINFDKGYLKVMGKGRKERIVPLGLKVRRAMLNYVYKRRMADDADDNQYLFLTCHRRRMTPDAIEGLITRLKERAGIGRLYTHLFRHTFATNFLVYGIGDVYELSRLLGHSDIRTTEKYLQLASYYTILQKRKHRTYLDLAKK